MAWLKIEKAPLVKSTKREATPDGLWLRCSSCQEIIYKKDFETHQHVCPKCNHHFPIPALMRIHFFLDPETFIEHDTDLRSVDPLRFTDTKPYNSRLSEYQEKLDLVDAIVCGEGLLNGRSVQIAAYDFRFMGGSMGAVVGEKIHRTFQRAKEKKQPAIVFSTSGGARMQEGLFSLMQMAKTCASLALLKEEGVPLISVLSHPTTGGVAASYAMLGDINIAEPKALIGFAGPRVIQQTIGQSLPEGFQTAEYLLQHGMVDLICRREHLREKITNILAILCGSQNA